MNILNESSLGNHYSPELGSYTCLDERDRKDDPQENIERRDDRRTGSPLH